ncbi:MAG: hypothetical protein LKG25_00765 [Prevotella sp.]|jgi:hypothetical protein|nr:hypothetical protein [Prevotella sp.]MCI1281108.1 hypothetical protein [Prevotella sp.]
MKKDFKIGVPKLQEASFVIDVNGTKCKTFIDGNGEVKYNLPDYKVVDCYGDLELLRKALFAIASLVRSAFAKEVFNDKRNARSGQKASK